jgi:hypothetical protein
MHVSVGSAFIMAGAIVVVLALFVVIVILANRRPYFKRPKPAREPVTGGVHRGDPRSVSPRRDEYVEPPADQHG